MRFDDGEKTGRKADPAQVAADMKTARDIEGTRKFNSSKWLAKTQVQGLFFKTSFDETKENVSWPCAGRRRRR